MPFAIIMNCEAITNCMACVLKCLWVFRDDLDPVCAPALNKVVGSIRDWIKPGGYCHPDSTTTSSPPSSSSTTLPTIIINEGYTIGDLFLMLFLGLLIASLCFSIPICFHIYRGHTGLSRLTRSAAVYYYNLTRRNNVPMDEVPSNQTDYYKRFIEADPLLNDEEIENNHAQQNFNHPRQNRRPDVNIAMENEPQVEIQLNHPVQVAPLPRRRRRNPLELLTDGNPVIYLDRSTRRTRTRAQV